MTIMPAVSRRLNVTLDPAYSAKLAKMAERTHVNEGTLARSLLSQALDEADPDPRHVIDLLDGLPGALERANQGLKDAKAGRTVTLADL
jgi:predicted transcriptional regulator